MLPVLRSPDFNKEFVLQTDASNRGIGAVLSQRDAEGGEIPIAYFSKKLLPREEHYSTIEKECLAIKLGIYGSESSSSQQHHHHTVHKPIFDYKTNPACTLLFVHMQRCIRLQASDRFLREFLAPPQKYPVYSACIQVGLSIPLLYAFSFLPASGFCFAPICLSPHEIWCRPAPPPNSMSPLVARPAR